MTVRHTTTIRPKSFASNQVATTIRPTTDQPIRCAAKVAPDFITIRSTPSKTVQNLYSHNSAKNAITIRPVTVGGLLALLTMMPWKDMAVGLELLRAGQGDRGQWPIEIQNALNGTQYFDKIRLKAIYWYLIEMIAQRLKTGELRNAKIYEFNPDVLHDPKRQKNSKSASTNPAKTIPQNGIPPPEKKT